MRNRNNKALTDPIQLQQKIIYFQSELKKYQNIVKDFENNYHITQFQKLKEENDSLKNQLHDSQYEFQQEIDKLKKEIEELNHKNIELEEKSQSLKKDLEDISPTVSHSGGRNSPLSVDEMKIINELDTQFRDLLIQSFNNDKLLDPKRILIKELEEKIDKLTKEIEE